MRISAILLALTILVYSCKDKKETPLKPEMGKKELKHKITDKADKVNDEVDKLKDNTGTGNGISKPKPGNNATSGSSKSNSSITPQNHQKAIDLTTKIDALNAKLDQLPVDQTSKKEYINIENEANKISQNVKGILQSNSLKGREEFVKLNDKLKTLVNKLTHLNNTLAQKGNQTVAFNLPSNFPTKAELKQLWNTFTKAFNGGYKYEGAQDKYASVPYIDESNLQDVYHQGKYSDGYLEHSMAWLNLNERAAGLYARKFVDFDQTNTMLGALVQLKDDRGIEHDLKTKSKFDNRITPATLDKAQEVSMNSNLSGLGATDWSQAQSASSAFGFCTIEGAGDIHEDGSFNKLHDMGHKDFFFASMDKRVISFGLLQYNKNDPASKNYLVAQYGKTDKNQGAHLNVKLRGKGISSTQFDHDFVAFPGGYYPIELEKPTVKQTGSFGGFAGMTLDQFFVDKDKAGKEIKGINNGVIQTQNQKYWTGNMGYNPWVIYFNKDRFSYNSSGTVTVTIAKGDKSNIIKTLTCKAGETKINNDKSAIRVKEAFFAPSLTIKPALGVLKSSYETARDSGKEVVFYIHITGDAVKNKSKNTAIDITYPIIYYSIMK
ncbi:hypothetical protein [Flammeovirga kamogawensis]|uniref:Lipoprotein n=1 Tax=Flammeovirga kamogawensis TaxID=373891 RepID=A0ABX8H4M2_9BACT|nr:hypothetical protein [Flammeovirga kamogawensis]MBB6460491.1 hypothetical protein [Flammeovirga kamogawensis]QWG10297.1 hypothetical protein KM029_21680 [Flammeovirga kamogawensis]TRX64745.1 hypothetical protein EO216_19600 [Flammeovirga kamogawensis]